MFIKFKNMPAIFRYFKERFSILFNAGLGAGAITLGIAWMLVQIGMAVLLFIFAVKGISIGFGIGGFLSGIIAWALVFWIPLGEYVAFGFVIYAFYHLARGG